MAACKINLSDLIIQEANAQGIDPGIALAVARTDLESATGRRTGRW